MVMAVLCTVNWIPFKLIGSDKINMYCMPVHRLHWLHRDLPQACIKHQAFFFCDQEQGILDVSSCKSSFLYTSIFFKLCWSFSICFQHRTHGYGSFQGNATGDLVEFLGMLFAAPPYASTQIFPVVILLIVILLFLKSVGDLRFALAEPPLKFTGVHQATSFGAAGIQQAINIPSVPGGGSASGPGLNVTSEDCMDYLSL